MKKITSLLALIVSVCGYVYLHSASPYPKERYQLGGELEWEVSHKAYRVEDTNDKKPAALNPARGTTTHGNLQVLDNGAYIVKYDNFLKGPAEVDYTLDWVKRSFHKMKRPQIPFATDNRTSAKVDTRDFSRCGYDRGHMAPSFAIGAFNGDDDQNKTFICSNILPQTHLCNAGVWNSIERMEADDFAKRFGKIYVSDGPIYNANPEHINNGIAVPAAFYKVIQRPDGDVICFVVPQIPESSKPESYLSSLQDIRTLTGLNLLPEIPAEKASLKRGKIW